mmetsp:Transcript_14807/g.24108  ORF Transcript_14807/g.24108 Transcript_14807/m.24108 type:complete len:86 (+) Transcript_14807:36-293(+)
MEAKGDKSLIHTGEQGRKEVEAFEANLVSVFIYSNEFIKTLCTDKDLSFNFHDRKRQMQEMPKLSIKLRLLIIMERERQMTSRRR